mgnify:CR=1 FL=1
MKMIQISFTDEAQMKAFHQFLLDSVEFASKEINPDIGLLTQILTQISIQL